MTALTAWQQLGEVERVARCRSAAVAARLIAGPRSAALVEALRLAEVDAASLLIADAELHRLPTVLMRRIICSITATLPEPTRAIAAAPVIRLVATAIAVDGPTLLLAAAGLEVRIALPPAELVAVAGALLQAARMGYGRIDWPPASLP